MKSVFVLWFVRNRDLGDKEPLLLGVYHSEIDAKAAIDRLKDKPGFVDDPAGFEFHEHEIGKDNWTEGFILD